MFKVILKKFLLGSVVLALVASCSDDESDGWGDEIVSAPAAMLNLDSIELTDSLYSWYLEKRACCGDSSSSSRGTSSTSAVSSANVSSDSGSSSSFGISCSSGISSSSAANSAAKDPDDEGSNEEASKVRLLPPAGFYDELTIPVPAPEYGGKIRCTFNGSEPTSVAEEFVEPYVVNRNTVARCAEFVGDSVARKSSHTFFINEKVSMPVVAISVDPYKMFDSKNGYYSQGVSYCAEPCREANYWWDLELPVHVEFFENGSASTKRDWQIDAGLSIIGQWSRYRAKKSVAIKMKSEYQDGRIKFPLFKTRPEANKFKAFNLRNNGNRFVSDYIEDPVLTSLMEGSGVDYQRSRQVVVFYNGAYYGIFDMRERLNEHFVETNYGIDSKQVNMVKHIETTVTASGGSADSYLEMLDFIDKSDFGTDAAAYEKLQTMMDVGNYADYMAAEIYIHNGDWPDNNVRAWNTADQPFKFMIFDVDHGFGWDWAVSGFQYMNHNMFNWIRQGGTNLCFTSHCFAQIYLKLSRNDNFKRLFINHSAVMLDYYLSYERVVEATDRMTATIPYAEMDRDMKMYPRNEHSFDKTGATLKSYASTRTAAVRREYRLEFGLGDDISVTIGSTGNGNVLLDGMKLPSTNYTGTFFAGNDMLLTATPTGGSVFDGWSDGNMENPRLVSPVDGSKFIAKFK